jgi:hypothetical protein
MTDTEKPHLKFQHVYAVVRIDLPVNESNPANSVAVVKVLFSKSAAEEEVSRLSKINEEKGCSYTLYTTRLIPQTD